MIALLFPLVLLAIFIVLMSNRPIVALFQCNLVLSFSFLITDFLSAYFGLQLLSVKLIVFSLCIFLSCIYMKSFSIIMLVIFTFIHLEISHYVTQGTVTTLFDYYNTGNISFILIAAISYKTTELIKYIKG